jgi:hypothetical protein
MNKLLTTIALVAVTSVALIGGASAMPGKGNGNQTIAQQFGGGFQSPQYNGGAGGFNVGGGHAGGEIDSPGDAFYPDRSFVGDPRQDCLDAGGKPVRQHGAAVEWACVL